MLFCAVQNWLAALYLEGLELFCTVLFCSLYLEVLLELFCSLYLEGLELFCSVLFCSLYLKGRNCSVLYTWRGWNRSVLFSIPEGAAAGTVLFFIPGGAGTVLFCSVLFSIPLGFGTVLFSIPGGAGTVLFYSLYLEGLEPFCSVLYTWRGWNRSVLFSIPGGA